MIYFGFSGAGSLAARMVSFAPERTMAAVEFAPGQGDPLGMDTVTLSGKALAVPQLIVVHGADRNVGTARPYAFFEQYRKRGAPLTFLVQNRTPHCCVANIVPLMLAWMDDIVRLRKPAADCALRPVDRGRGWMGMLQVQDSGVKEALWHARTWNIAAAEIEPKSSRVAVATQGLEIPRAPTDAQVPGSGQLPPAWLPSRAFAQEWLAFARQKEHPITPLE